MTVKTSLQKILFLHFISISVTQLSDRQCKLPSDLSDLCFCVNNNYLQCSGLNTTTSLKYLDQNLSHMLTQIEIINSDITCINLGKKYKNREGQHVLLNTKTYVQLTFKRCNPVKPWSI